MRGSSREVSAAAAALSLLGRRKSSYVRRYPPSPAGT